MKRKAISKLIIQIIICTFFLIPNNTMSQTFEKSILRVNEKYDLVGGTVVLFDKNKINNITNWGNSNLEFNTPITDNTVFRVASISKTITALAFMQLVEQKKIQLDEDVSKSLGFEFRNPYAKDIPITPRMLLSHTSGLQDDVEAYDKFLNMSYEENPSPNISKLLSKNGEYFSKSIFLNKKPGSYFNYSNLNYGIIGTVIENISGIRFDEYCRKYILMPLDIEGSFNVNDIKDINQIASLYRKPDGLWKVQFDNFINSDRSKIVLKDYEIGKNALKFAPQGGLRISGKDLAKIFMLFLNDGLYKNQQIISKNAIKAMTTSQWKFDGTNGNTNNGLFRNWGLGIHLITNTKDNDDIYSGNVSMLGHSGEAYGLVCDAFVDVINGNGFIFITNGSGKEYINSDCSSFYAIEKEIFEIIEKQYQKK